MKKLFKWLVVLLVLAGAGGGGAWWYLTRTRKAGPVFETVELTRGPLVVSVSANGTLNPVATVLVGSQVSGRIESLKAGFNSVVKRGQVIAQIEQSPFISKVRQCEAASATAAWKVQDTRTISR